MREQRKILVGRVLSNHMDKTVVVEIRQRKRHRLYGKVITVRKRFKAHDDDNACQVGDLVRMIECRPLSREKRWMVTEIVQSGVEAAVPEATPAGLSSRPKQVPSKASPERSESRSASGHAGPLAAVGGAPVTRAKRQRSGVKK